MIGSMAPGGRTTLTRGDRIGDYEVLAPVGAGGMGSVYKVRHTISERVEALKIVLPNAAATPEAAERFLREIRLLASLEHPHIAALHNAFRVNGDLFMVMELVDGSSLRDKLRSPGITQSQALEYAQQVLAALAFAHTRGVIHRDIKPSNVMIAPHGVVKLLDFGLAASLPAGPRVDDTITQPGTLLGSPHYISPEQARGDRADARSDIYSTGAMLFEMITGRPPFAAGSAGAFAIIAAHLHQTPQPPWEINPRVSPELGAVVLKALAKNPSDRFQSAAEFAATLQSARADAVRFDDTVTVANTSAPQPLSPQPTAPTPAADASAHSAGDLERISKELATYIGPIAHILVRRAAQQNRSLSDLCRTLAQEISSASKREQFLAAISRPPLIRSAAGTPSAG
jgi:eukaryotic-like serine/threonine-protein kinase